VKRTVLVVTALALSAVSCAKAQQFDLSTMTCDSFVKGDKAQMKLISAWLAGYYTDEAAEEAVDVSAINKIYGQLITFCTREPGFPIESAADGILGDDSKVGAASSNLPQSNP
jgi:hypothetical protein